MTEVEQQQQQPPLSQNGIDLSGGEDDEKGCKSRPADIEQVTEDVSKPIWNWSIILNIFVVVFL